MNLKLLFVHQNFPGQFQHLAPAMQATGCEVRALHMRKVPLPEGPTVEMVRYEPSQGSTPQAHPWARDLETKVIRAEACFRAAQKMKQGGFEPNVIVAHPGWGEALFLKEVWPRARLGLYCEFFYRAQGADTGFDPEFTTADPEGEACRLRLKNLNHEMHMAVADSGLSPTRWQASTFPEPFRQRITVAHDGIDTAAIAPNPGAWLSFQSGLKLSREDEVITFVNRNLEPYRGYHVFMRALPEILRRRPRARVLIVGGSGVSYGAAPPNHRSWKQIFIDEVKPQIPPGDWARVHFLGELPHHYFVTLLQLSTLHVYLTYPFVLSWSLLEAMSAGATILASDTAPVREVITHNETGRLVDFFDVAGLAEQVDELLQDASTRQRLGAAARELTQERYDLKTVCLPAQQAWVNSMR